MMRLLSMADPQGPIGVFDSGVGGLTVFRQIADRLPFESIVYLGDTARVPYGTKSPETVIRYARACARILLAQKIKLMVVACNTASAYAVPALRRELGLPVIGVIEPGVSAALRKTRNRRVGVIGTAGTIASNVYPDLIRARAPETQVFCQACPLFVPLAEEGWISGDVPRAVAHRYLGEFRERMIDTLVLGCTHYPLMAEVIGETLGSAVTLVDSAEETAAVVMSALQQDGLQRNGPNDPSYRFLVSDAPDAFRRIGRKFLDRELAAVEWVDF